MAKNTLFIQDESAQKHQMVAQKQGGCGMKGKDKYFLIGVSWLAGSVDCLVSVHLMLSSLFLWVDFRSNSLTAILVLKGSQLSGRVCSLQVAYCWITRGSCSSMGLLLAIR